MRRRPFLRAAATAAAAAAGGAAGLSLSGLARAGAARGAADGAAASGAAEGRSATVASLRTEAGADAAGASLDAGFRALGLNGKRLFQAGDRVAVKLNCLSGPRLSPRRELVDALVERIAGCGVARRNIVVFDRTSEELVRAGFSINESREAGVRCFGTDALAGGGYAREIAAHRSIASLFSLVVADFATVLVSVGVAKDHDLSGVSGVCKNLYGVIHNPNRYHENRCDPFLADLCDHPMIRPKLRLSVVDALRAQCHGGPAFHPSYTFEPSRILLGTDPIAVDRILAGMIDEERLARGLPDLEREERAPTWLARAEALGVGVAALERIRVVEA